MTAQVPYPRIHYPLVSYAPVLKYVLAELLLTCEYVRM